ncbi:MAG: hypothetical protein IIW92_12490 [Lachnospiraceae bacterium]|nr:hypothetical protein [Lachnospiraceae bacterium]MBQ5919372.1 hypothetical protein [Lachnospiraceae bacterium]
MGTYNIPERLMVICCKDDNKELLDILKCYLEWIPNISNITMVKQYTFYKASEFVYIVTKTLERIFFKLYDYIAILQLFLVKAKNPVYYTYTPRSLYDYKTEALVNKKALIQYIKGI